ncbi:hypothetical protein CDAR_434571 [Caerostris darwini]|uniref:Uncharacterized protein n=1 Tax=Caerostris darwini TaxID=1538125 RepID=A0AAV4PI78_9ARAC|nr:hypothetical protein CDAR_434571 [Caerostris darwini]
MTSYSTPVYIISVQHTNREGERRTYRLTGRLPFNLPHIFGQIGENQVDFHLILMHALNHRVSLRQRVQWTSPGRFESDPSCTLIYHWRPRLEQLIPLEVQNCCKKGQ